MARVLSLIHISVKLTDVYAFTLETIDAPELVLTVELFTNCLLYTSSTGSDYDPSVARVIAEVPHSIVAASIVNHLVYASTDQAQLFVAPEDDLVEMEYVSQLPAVVVDMA